MEFVCAGAQKAGTTSLHWYLFGHPGFSMPGQKELHFFSNEALYGNGAGWYESKFPPEGVAGEVCPDYLFIPGALERIRAYNPGMKVIVLLRDPVERALSHWSMERGRGNEPLPLEEALFLPDDEVRRDRMSLEVRSYRQRGRYAEQLDRLYGLFPQGQVRLVKSSDLERMPRVVTEGICLFLGHPQDYGEYEFRRYAEGSKVECPDRVRERLEEEFEPWNRRLSRYYGVDL